MRRHEQCDTFAATKLPLQAKRIVSRVHDAVHKQAAGLLTRYCAKCNNATAMHAKEPTNVVPTQCLLPTPRTQAYTSTYAK